MGRRSIILSILAAITAATVALPSGAAGDQLPPPGPTGCGDGLTVSDQDPSAQLPATMRYRHETRRVNLRLRRPTQVTRVEITAFLPGGQRVDTRQAGEYTCTTPGATDYIAFGVDRRVFTTIRRRRHVRLRIRLLMVNANGRATTLRRTVTVTRQRSR
jgi:hypothetical protein